MTCRTCGVELTTEEQRWYGTSCEKCERRLMTEPLEDADDLTPSLWRGTRRCPTCASCDLVDEAQTEGEYIISCKNCGRWLRTDHAGGPPEEDPEWVASGVSH